jgi:hypothetical protein
LGWNKKCTRRKPVKKKQKNRRIRANNLAPNEMMNLPTSIKLSAPNKDGQNFIQNIPLPNSPVIRAKTERRGGTSMNPKEGWFPSAR